MGVSNIISLLSGVALFLFGMTLMGDGLKRVAGNRLELVLYRLTNTPIKGILLGAGVTAVIQSSSATSVMVVGFVNSGMMKFKNAIGIVLGAILGTSITGWIICLSSFEGAGGWVSLLSTTTLTGVVAVAGIILRMFCKKQEQHHIGDILMGFAVLMFGMSAMSTAVSPLRESEVFLSVMTSFSSPLLGLLVGALFTCMIQSASAAVGILQALAVTGAVSFSTALPIIMGISIGAAFPVLLSALGANVNGRRTAFAYLLIDAIGSVLLGSLFYLINAVSPMTALTNTTMTMVSVAALNTIFRFAMVLLFAPGLTLLVKITCFLVKDKQEKAYEQSDMDLLEERFVSHPALAIAQSRTVINSMARRAQESIALALSALSDYSESEVEEVNALETLIDKYEDCLGTYLVKVTGQELSGRQNEDISKFLHTITDFERISDHARNIGECAQEIYDKKIEFSDAAKRELSVLQSALTEILALAIDAFINNDLQLATRVEPLEEMIDSLCNEIKLHHISRIKEGVCTLHQGFVFNDLLTNYERVADHCSNIAVAIIELESDIFDTHEYIESLKEMKDASFACYLKEYQDKYVLDVR